MHSELCIEVGKRVERMRVVEAALILTVTALYLAVVAGRVWPYELVPYAKVGSSLFKERDQVAL